MFRKKICLARVLGACIMPFSLVLLTNPAGAAEPPNKSAANDAGAAQGPITPAARRIAYQKVTAQSRRSEKKREAQLEGISKEPEGRLGEVLVTAQKRLEPLQDVPVSVSVQTGEQLITHGLTQLSDYAAQMPGFNVQTGGSPGVANVSIRGISSSTSVAVISTYIDDTPVGSSAPWGFGAWTPLDILPYDLSRIELLRGPQGTLYGAGAMGGVIKYVLKAPSLTQTEINFGGGVETINGAGTQGYSLRGRVNVPLIDGILGATLSVYGKTNPGYMTNLYSGARDTNRYRQYGGRFALLWAPMASLSIKLTAMTDVTEVDDFAVKQFASSTEASVGAALFTTPMDPLPDLTENNAFPNVYTEHFRYFSTILDWNPGPFDLVSATSWSYQHAYVADDLTPALGTILPYLGGSQPGLAEFENPLGVGKFTQEVRLVSPTGQKVEWLAGVFDTHESSYNTEWIKAFDDAYQPTAPTFPPGLSDGLFPETYDEYALYGDVTWNITPAFGVTGGGRFAHNRQVADFSVASTPISTGATLNITSNDSSSTWLGTAQYHVTRNTMVYVRTATGYRPGGPNTPGLSGVPFTYKADSLINYEIGIKSSAFDHKLQVDGDAYQIDWKDIQLTACVGFQCFLTNAGKAASRGGELSALMTPIDGLTLGLNGAYTDSHLTSVIPASQILLTGYQLPGVPTVSVSATADYDWAIAGQWRAGLGVTCRYVDQQYLGPVSSTGSGTVRVPGFSVFDLNSRLSSGHVAFTLYLRNIANSRALTGGTGAGLTGLLLMPNSATGVTSVNTSFLQPRTLGLDVDLSF